MLTTYGSVGALFTVFIFFWASASVNLIRDEKKRSDYTALKLAESQINAVIRSEIDLLSMTSVRTATLLTSQSRVSANELQAVAGSKFSVWIPTLSNNLERVNANLRSNDSLNIFAQSKWQDFSKNTQSNGLPESIVDQAYLTELIGEESLVLIVPVIAKSGKLLGAVTTEFPISTILQYLSESTYIAKSDGSFLIGKSNKGMDSSKSPSTSDSAYSVVGRIQISKSSPILRIRADHPAEELWSNPEIGGIINFNFGLMVFVWGAIFLSVRNGSKTRNRQRTIIGSLVKKIVWITDEDGRIDYVLGKIGDHLGWKDLDYLDVDIALFVHPDDRALLTEMVTNVQKRIKSDEFSEIRFENKDREFRWYEVTVTNMIDVPEIRGIVVTAHDIEQRIHATAHILASKRAAEKANEAKSEFLSRMSHELRTPLNAILGFGQLLEMEAISDRQSENVEQILIAGRHLLGLVNDILDIARIETRKVNFSLERVNVQEVLEESFSLLGPLSSKSEICLNFNQVSCLDIMSDRQRLKQIFLNLLSNGIKYNKAGGEVNVSIEQNEDGIKIMFADSGIGIEPGYIDRVFTPFDRLGSEDSKIEGTGLGLALSKTLADAMGANLEVTSEFGKGSIFILSFPHSLVVDNSKELLLVDGNNTSQSGFDNPDNLRVLIIEDNIVNLRYISKVVEKLDGISLLSAKEGGVGIEMARTHQPDLILLDLDLPDISGQEVLKVLRADAIMGQVCIIVMSAETNPHIVEQILALGAQKFVTKPVDVGSLFALFNEEKNAA